LRRGAGRHEWRRQKAQRAPVVRHDVPAAGEACRVTNPET